MSPRSRFLVLLCMLWAVAALAQTFTPGTPLETCAVNGALGANWSSPILSTDTGALECIGNRIDAPASGNHSAYWDAATFGPDVQVSMAIPDATDSTALAILYARLIDPGEVTATNGYEFRFTPGVTDNVLIRRLTNSVGTTLSTTAVTVADGDSLGASVIEDQVCAWHKPAAGSWTQVDCETDATYTAAGNVGILTNTTAFAFDDFWAATFTEATQPVRAVIVTFGGVQ